jgi:hypothetical protein
VCSSDLKEILFWTFCDYGQPGRRCELRYHFSLRGAEDFFKSCSRNIGTYGRVWFEDKSGAIIRITE